MFEPRDGEKRRTDNSVVYDEQVILSIRGHYAHIHGRRTGMTDGPLGGKNIAFTLSGLREPAPKQAKVKLPMLKGDLNKMRRVVDLNNSHRDRTPWSLLLLPWKGVMS